MNPAPPPAATPQPPAQAGARVCDRCGRFDGREIGDTRLCDDCYCEAGACCAADDDDSPSGVC